MSLEKREIFGSKDDDTPVNVHLTGGRYFFITFSAFLMSMGILGICGHLDENNKLKKQELEIKKQQLEISKKQFALDSMRFEQSRRAR